MKRNLLKQKMETLGFRLVVNFNSFKVRLRLYKDYTKPKAIVPFQFLQGAIKTDGGKRIEKFLLRFQFLQGAIKT